MNHEKRKKIIKKSWRTDLVFMGSNTPFYSFIIIIINYILPL